VCVEYMSEVSAFLRTDHYFIDIHVILMSLDLIEQFFGFMANSHGTLLLYILMFQFYL
jgi:hypothetical protein